ncbi:hypothetical protein SARC_06163 [Sphaeroforma arctica JP610]|uniref:U3 small nucleolar RNA-associated protein 13 C-terminal domain-containing protein n=1 Tax=Sphaeroforma arctica JP610 TaxID=667725 RepID=A0A0L0FXF9_9EUKA|nr:hypothetical protein SARC_06163 [Sphaeroforma arctica JP610]KNC81517.1 hypothetical protein SARC_06163 [Sphaeroforma arctica JP610]|eukprot:XP_014155419.1 hypothetical protein SARC_06163 [Sphaeroforma arctica JP610]
MYYHSFECVAIGAGHNDGVSACAFNKKAADASKRGFVVSAGQDLTVKLWNVTGINTQADADTDPSAHEQSMELIPAMTVKGHDKDINTVAVAPNDRMFVTGSHDRTAKLWSTQDLSLLGTLRGHKRGIWHAEFSPVDRVVATASGDKTIKLWSITDFTCVKTLEGHTGGVLKLAFMSRGMQMASSAADGLCKIWTLKTSECEDTMDGHTDKVWALTLNKSESRIVSGGGDSVLNVWRDTTVQQQEEVERVSEEKMLLTQELMNLVQNKQYLKAAKLALRLDQPHRMRELMEEIVESDHVTGGERGVGKVVLALDDSQVSRLLGYVREWNTNARHSRIAQMVLMCVLKVIPPARMVTLDKIKNLIEALLPYSERHFSRLDRLEQQSFFVDYTWQGLRYGMVGNVMEAQHMGMAVKTITDDDKDFLGGDRRATDDTQKDKDPTAEDAPLISMQQQLEVATPPSGAEDGDSKSESESGSEGAEEVAVAVAGETNVADADEWAVEELVIPQSTAETKAGPSKAKRQSVQPTKGVKRQKIELEETDESGDSSDSESGSDNEFVEKMFKESNGATQKDSATPSSMKAGKTSGAKSANRDKSDPSNAEKGSGKSSTKKHNTPKNGTKPKPNSKPKPSSEPTRRSKRRKA